MHNKTHKNFGRKGGRKQNSTHPQEGAEFGSREEEFVAENQSNEEPMASIVMIMEDGEDISQWNS